MPGTKVRTLALECAAAHERKAELYKGKAEAIPEDEGDGERSSVQPERDLKRRARQHENQADEMKFIADHIDPDERYVLDWQALSRLGIVDAYR